MNTPSLRTLSLMTFCAILLILIITITDTNASGEKEPQWVVDIDDTVSSIDVSGNGKYSIISTSDTLYYYSMINPTELWNVTVDEEIFTSSISGNGEYSVVGSRNNSISFFQKNDPNPMWSYPVNGTISSLKMSGDGKRIIVSTMDRLFFIESTTNDTVWNFSGDGNITAMDISSDGQTIAVATDTNQIYLLGNESNIPLWNATIDDVVHGIDLSANGDYLAVGSADDNVYLFQGSNNTPLWNYTSNNDILSVAISSDGSYVTAGSIDGTIFLFQNDTSEPDWSYSAGGKINVVVISDDGSYITAGSDDRQIYHLHRDGITPLWNYSVNNDIRSIDMSNNGYYLAVRTTGNPIYVFTRVSAFIDSITPEIALDDDEIEFNALGISDNGAIIKYVWNSNIDEEFYNGSKKINRAILSLGYHVIGLKVKDEEGVWSPEIFMHIVVTDKPRANIVKIVHKEVDENYSMYFKGNGTVEVGFISAYIWRSDIDGEFYRGTDVDFWYGGLSHGEHTITFYVISNFGFESSTDIVGFYVNDIPTAQIDLIFPSTAIHSEEVTFWGSGSDSGDIASYEWTSSIDGEFYNGSDNTITYSSLSVGEHIILLKVKDDLGFWSKPVSSSLLIRKRPIAVIEGVSQQIIFVGQEITFHGNRLDSGPIQLMVWHSSINEEIYNGTEKTFSSDTLSTGEHEITMKIQDEEGYWSNEVTMTLPVLREPNVKATYLGSNVVALSFATEIELKMAIWISGMKQSENQSFVRNHLVHVTLLEGNNPYYFEFMAEVGIAFISPVYSIELEKISLIDEQTRSISLKRSQQLVIPIAITNSDGEVVGPLDKGTVIEVIINSNKRFDVFLVENEDLADWKKIKDGKSARLSYFKDYSSFNTSHFSFLLVTQEDVIYHLIVDNSDIIPRGAASEDLIEGDCSVMMIVSPGQGMGASYENNIIRFDFGEETNGSGSFFTLLSLLLIIISALIGVLYYANKNGLITIPEISFLNPSTEDEGDEGAEEDSDDNDDFQSEDGETDDSEDFELEDGETEDDYSESEDNEDWDDG